MFRKEWKLKLWLNYYLYSPRINKASNINYLLTYLVHFKSHLSRILQRDWSCLFHTLYSCNLMIHERRKLKDISQISRACIIFPYGRRNLILRRHLLACRLGSISSQIVLRPAGFRAAFSLLKQHKSSVYCAYITGCFRKIKKYCVDKCFSFLP